jgi:hypothetical protein
VHAYHFGGNHWGTDDVGLIYRNALIAVYKEQGYFSFKKTLLSI